MSEAKERFGALFDSLVLEAMNKAQLDALEGKAVDFQAVDQQYDRDFKIDSSCPARRSTFH